MIDLSKIPSPCYVMEERLLRKNLQRIKSVERGQELILYWHLKRLPCGKRFPLYENTLLIPQQAR